MYYNRYHDRWSRRGTWVDTTYNNSCDIKTRFEPLYKLELTTRLPDIKKGQPKSAYNGLVWFLRCLIGFIDQEGEAH